MNFDTVFWASMIIIMMMMMQYYYITIFTIKKYTKMYHFLYYNGKIFASPCIMYTISKLYQKIVLLHTCICTVFYFAFLCVCCFWDDNNVYKTCFLLDMARTLTSFILLGGKTEYRFYMYTLCIILVSWVVQCVHIGWMDSEFIKDFFLYFQLTSFFYHFSTSGWLSIYIT